ncbi:predicted protein [Sclerotinia sclerotiorum 1980 UF-70]|uniref:Uncharacterized protein n=1 Tax=Sclerotinia sclerotiorum (strain ATCC 18683 / 1980 / Ss-1) TaxID=665079 RepID=A7E824_SCLS1|nr:predicted protein [Sclerotinia sclerotiorum 1980 UF-70]EDN96526.1 predicted protein [Sclerotinia sclerotiorum 1980 UF-70]
MVHQRVRSWSPMSELEAERPSILEKRKKMKHPVAIEDSVETAPITSLELLGNAKMRNPDIFEGGQTSSANGIGSADIF